MTFQDNKSLKEITNPIVNVWYDRDGIPYLTLEFDAKFMDDKGFKHKVNAKIHKIMLNNIELNTETKTIRSEYNFIPNKQELISRKITFDLGCNIKDETITCNIE